MKHAPIPQNEEQRLLALKKYEVLDTLPENVFDEITSLASLICETEISLISLVDEGRQWFKSSVNLSAKETPRDISYCGHAIMGDDIFEVTDSSKDERFADNPLHLNSPNVNFYAGAPLINPDGYKIGTLCVIDSKPKELDETQKRTLKLLSKHVIKLLEMKLQNRELEKVKTHFNEVQSISMSGGWEFDIINNSIDWSDEVYKIHGVNIGEEVPLDEAINFYAPHERERLQNLMELAITEGKSFNETFEFYAKGGVKKWVRSIGSPLRNDKGEIIKLTGVFQDVTENVEFERELNHSNRLKSIGILAAGIGHEINNPLTVISGGIRKLRSTSSDDGTLDQMTASVDRIKNIVSGLRTFSRKDSEANKELFNPIKVIGETVNLLKEIYKANRITLHYHLPSQESEFFLEGDRGKFQQVLINLLNNAKEAIENLDDRLVAVEAKIDAEALKVFIRDSGKGVPRELRDKVFNPFYTTKEVGKGTGIGLSLVHKFVNEMKGTIKISDSEKSEFVVTIPTSDLSPVFKQENSVKFSSKLLTILVVDDEEGIRELLGDILQEKGHTILLASNGEEGLHVYKENKDKVDLIISDIKMPKMSGLELLQEVKEINKETKVILITGGVSSELEEEDVDRLADGKVLKPFSEEKLFESITKVIG